MTRYWLRSVLVFLISAFSVMSYAQTPQENNDAMAGLVKKYFNEHNAGALYGLTGDRFRAQVDSQKFLAIANNQLFPLGTIKESSFINYNNGISNYKLAFDAITLQLIIALDKSGKLQTLAFKPYEAPVALKSGQAQTSNPLSSSADRTIDTIARTYIQKQNTVGLSIGILKNNAMTTYGYGETAKGNGRMPTATTLFEIGSITKTFTSLLLAWYVIENKVKLDDPITKYLPDSLAANTALKSITLKMLSNHTSGLSRMPSNFEMDNVDSLNPYKNYDARKLYSYLKSCTLASTPGEKYDYSNTGAALLGLIMEHIGKKPYEQLVKDIICKPLHMNNTVQHLSREQLPEFVTVYDEQGKQTPAWDFSAMAAAGALRSSVHDMLLYAKANTEKGTDKLSKAIELTHHITYTKDPEVGLGWHVNRDGNNTIYWHNGGTNGSRSFIAFVPEKHVAIVALSNSVESVDATGQALLTAMIK